MASAVKSIRLHGILGINKAPTVSVDFNHDPHSSTFDVTQTQVLDKRFVRVLSWYDNEWGFSNRMVEVTAYFGAMAGSPSPALGRLPSGTRSPQAGRGFAAAQPRCPRPARGERQGPRAQRQGDMGTQGGAGAATEGRGAGLDIAGPFFADDETVRRRCAELFRTD